MFTKGPHYEKLPPATENMVGKRAYIKRELLKHFNPALSDLSDKHLDIMFGLYDRVIFNNILTINKGSDTLSFGVNIRDKNKGGIYLFSSNGYVRSHKIMVSKPLIISLFKNGEAELKSNGLICRDRVEAMMNIFEHEMVHMYCQLMGYSRKIPSGKGKMYYSSHGKLFQELAYRFFRHTDFRHELKNGDVSNTIDKTQCKLGMKIFFNTKDNIRIYGYIVKLNPKRCRIDTGLGKFYDVPYPMIRSYHKKE